MSCDSFILNKCIWILRKLHSTLCFSLSFFNLQFYTVLLRIHILWRWLLSIFNNWLLCDSLIFPIELTNPQWVGISCAWIAYKSLDELTRLFDSLILFCFGHVFGNDWVGTNSAIIIRLMGEVAIVWSIPRRNSWLIHYKQRAMICWVVD